MVSTHRELESRSTLSFDHHAEESEPDGGTRYSFGPSFESELTPPHGSTGRLVVGYLDELVKDLVRREHDAREDQREGVRKMRIATRRLRSALATYRPVLRTEQTEPLRHELRWLGRELGLPRDADVLREQLDAAMQSLQGTVRMSAVIQLLEVELGMRHEAAHARLLEALDSPRYWS